MTNLAITMVIFLLETNWGTTHVITPVPGFYNSTTFYLQTAIVERVEYREDAIKGIAKRREVDREFVPAIATNIPPRLWPTNAPPSMLSTSVLLLRRRQDSPGVPAPPVPR